MEGGIRESCLGTEIESIGAKFRLWAVTRDYTTEVLNFHFGRKAIERDISQDSPSPARAGQS